MAKKGIDVSTWQGNINFNKVKADGIDFVIIRAGYGVGNKDRWFEENYRKAKAAGLNVGAYWYSYASSIDGVIREARSCMSVLKGKQFEYPVYYDIEERSQLNRGMNFCSSLIRNFCNELEKNGYFAGFYMSLSHALNYASSDVRNRYAFWVAQWSSSCDYKGQYGLWQYSSNGSVSGIGGRCDMDYSYVDYPSIIKSGGFNGYKGGSKPTPKPKVKTVDELADEVLAGKWGNGNDRYNRLTNAGYNYDKVQARVNEKLGITRKLKPLDTIAWEVIRGDWGNGNERVNRLTKAGYDYNKVQKRVNELL